MMVIFFAQRVILGKANFEALYGEPKYIPDTLKTGVAQILITECGMPELVPVEYGGTLKEGI